jgi:protein O-mannosyl-transferase
MENIEPSYGYSVLAQLMAGTQHRVAITTNFDNLVADALAIYTQALPLVCGHESLTGFIRPNLQRPLVAKIHRDLLLSPKNEPGELETLPKGWVDALTMIFENYTPIVIGYGGNDGSLMGLLKSVAPIKGGLFWCYRGGEEPDPRIHEVVEHHDGYLVPILGFDELMLQLWERLGLESPKPELQKTHNKRVASWQKQFEELNKRVKQPGSGSATEKELEPVRQAAAAAVQRLTKEEDWWAWQLKADAETDPAKKEAIFREGLNDFPKSAELTGNFANFVKDVRKDYDEAEQLYRKALELDPNSAINTGNFALFMKNVRKDYDEAEQLYRKALELDPNNARYTGAFGNFINDVRKDYDEAEQLYRKALELDPNDAINTGNFANFMKNVRKDYDEAEQLFRKALELDPNNGKFTCSFALFMEDVRKDYDEAERLFRKALELDPNSAINTGTFALFMENVRKDYDEAEQLYRKALELDPNSVSLAVAFALFMVKVREDPDEFERLFHKALELDPNNAINLHMFASFMENVRKDYDEAERLYRNALALDPNNDYWKNQLATFLQEHPKRRTQK